MVQASGIFIVYIYIWCFGFDEDDASRDAALRFWKLDVARRGSGCRRRKSIQQPVLVMIIADVEDQCIHMYCIKM